MGSFACKSDGRVPFPKAANHRWLHCGFLFYKAALVIEVDGPIHVKQKDYDRERDEQLKSRGLKVIHIKNEEIEQNLERVLEEIRVILNQTR